MELVHYDSFGSVYYERTAGGHELYFAEVYLLLLDVAELPLGILLSLFTLGNVPYYKTEGYVKRSRVGIAFQPAFGKVIFRFVQPVLEIL